eukprot:476545-Rhodomonas_salina.1
MQRRLVPSTNSAHCVPGLRGFAFDFALSLRLRLALALAVSALVCSPAKSNAFFRLRQCTLYQLSLIHI